MPCFKGLAVSIHTPDGPLPEHSIQKQAKHGRITSYIAVPPPKISSEKAEQSTFAISITLLTPGLSVPYSSPKPTPENPYPRPQIVGGLPTSTGDRGNYGSVIGPYSPLTSSENETVAAYIYFDGRQKEEVATLLRRGEETWVNSRWVGVPESEGGGLAEREFLFREVGLERWLNGLDLHGKDAAAKVERRRQRMEKKRRKKVSSHESDEEDGPLQWGRRKERNHQGVLRYGADAETPLEKLSDEDNMLSTDEESDDDPIPESAGQIKVALFRVLASGEIKKGEYSPQFDAHDDDEDSMKDDKSNGASGGDADIDHATSFAKPKSLDPKSISTQTVTGIDGPDKPYAVFTFLYRGEKQLQKMGILKPRKPATVQAITNAAKRRSMQDSLAELKPLRAGASLNFTGIRDGTSPALKNGKRKGDDDMESDEEDTKSVAIIEKDNEDFDVDSMSPEDIKRQGELSKGVQKMKLKRQHSFDRPEISPSTNDPSHPVPDPENTPTSDPQPTAVLPSVTYNPFLDLAPIIDSSMIGSPLKRQRASLDNDPDEEARRNRAEALAQGLGFGFTVDTVGGSTIASAAASIVGGPLLSSTTNPKENQKPAAPVQAAIKEEEEL